MGKRRRRRNANAWWRQQYGGMPAWGLAVALVVVVVLSAVTVSGLNRDDAAASGPRQTLRPVPTATFAAPERIAIVGDSNTEVDSPNFVAGEIGGSSWVRVLTRGGYDFVGGWADGGTTSTIQAENLEPVADVDTLLIMTGTNDLGFGVSFDETTANLDTMVEKVPADRVVLLAVAPRDEETTPSSTDYNTVLRDLASQRGWEFFDGMDFLRATDGGFAEGMTRDGVHLSADAQKRFGKAVLTYLAG